MPNKVSILFEIDQDAQGRTTLKQIDKGVDDIGKTAKKTSSDVDKFINGFKAAIVIEFFRQGASAAFDFGKEAVNAFNQANAAALGLASVAKFKGLDAQSTTEIVKNLDLVKSGLLTVGDASTTVKNLLQAGFSLEQSIDLLKRFGDSAAFGRQGSLSFGQAVVSTSEGIRNQNSILSDNGGITKNLSVILRERGFELQDTSDKLKGAAAREALYQGLLVETTAQIGDAAKLTTTFAGGQAKLEAQQQKLLVTLGEMITKNPELAKSFASISLTLEYLTLQLQDSQSGLSKFVNTTVSDFGTLIAITAKLARGVGDLASAYGKFKQLTLLGAVGAIGFNTGKPDVLDIGGGKKGSEDSSKVFADFEKRLSLLSSKPLIDLDSLKQGQKYTDEINKSNEAYFKKLEESNKQFQAGIREVGSATEDLQAKLSANPIASLYDSGLLKQQEFLTKFKDVPKEMLEGFRKVSNDVLALDLFKGRLSQASLLNNLILERDKLEAGLGGKSQLSVQDQERLARLQKASLDTQLATAQKFASEASNPLQRSLANEQIIAATSDISKLSPEQIDIRLKALNDSIGFQQQLAKENFERAKEQLGAQKDNTAALVQVGNSLVQMDEALKKIATREGFIKIEIDNSLNSRIDRLPDNN